MASAEPMVEDFLYEVGQLERQEEIKRVLRTLKLNPFELLGVPFDAKEDEVTIHDALIPVSLNTTFWPVPLRRSRKSTARNRCFVTRTSRLQS